MQSYREIKTDLQHLKAGAGTIVEKNEKPGRGAAVAGYFNSGAVSLRFIFGEKENIVFAFLQWAVIGIAYYLWVQALALVPEDVWQSGDGGDSAVSLVLLMWSFVCVGLAAYPLGLLTACMNASYILRFTGRESTVAECLKIVLPKSWSLWVFSWLDGWWTVMRILERLPKKNDRTPLAVKLANEAVYQGWKLSSLGFLPALLSGRSVGEACGDSLNLLKERFGMLVKLRIGYSLVCWGFGIVGYLGMFALLWMLPELSGSIFEDNAVYEFYLLAGAPLLAVLIFIMLVFRPVYVISACRHLCLLCPGKRSEYQAAGKFFPRYQRPDGFSAVGGRAGGSLVFPRPARNCGTDESKILNLLQGLKKEALTKPLFCR